MRHAARPWYSGSTMEAAMTPEQLRAAAERLHRMASKNMGLPMDANKKAFVEDCWAVSVAVLAEHPADDGGEVTRATMRRLGVPRHDDDTYTVAEADGDLRVVWYPTGVQGHPSPLIALWIPSGVIYQHHDNTFGSLVRLCEAIGDPVPLKD